MAEFKKLGDTFFLKGSSGQLTAVSEPETIKGLKTGQLGFESISNLRGLKFDDDLDPSTTPSRDLSFGDAPTITPPPQDTTKAPPPPADDFKSTFRKVLSNVFSGDAGVSNLADLQTKRQELLRKQMLSAPFSEGGEGVLSGSQKLALMRSRGAEFEPFIQSIENKILQAQGTQQMKMQNLTLVLGLADKLESLGSPETTSKTIEYTLAKKEGFEGTFSDWMKDEVKADSTTDIKEYNLAKSQGYDGSFLSWQTLSANLKAQSQIGGMDARTFTAVQKVVDKFDSHKLTNNFNEVQNKFASVIDIVKSDFKGPADLALVFEFMKALDPTSVVRESEYATAAAAGPIMSNWATKFEGLFTEGQILPTDVKDEFLNIIGKKYNVALDEYRNLRTEKSKLIDAATGKEGDGNFFLTDYESAIDFGTGQEDTPTLGPELPPAGTVTDDGEGGQWIVNAQGEFEKIN